MRLTNSMTPGRWAARAPRARTAACARSGTARDAFAARAASSCGLSSSLASAALAGGARQLHHEALGRQRAVHVQQQQALAAATAREDEVQRPWPGAGFRTSPRSARHAAGRRRGHGCRSRARPRWPSPSGPAAAGCRARASRCRPRPARAGPVGVDQQADVHAVAVLEGQRTCSSARRAAISPPSGCAKWPARGRTPSASAWPSAR
jgi:hypothetical protein